MNKLALIVVFFVGGLLVYVAGDFPDWGDPTSPASTHVGRYYLENSIRDTHVPNVVTSVLADYRGFDTMFETGVVFIAGIAVLALLRRTVVQRREEGELASHHLEAPQSGVVVRTASRIMIPFMQLYALYVIGHGHHSPGGGFQGGVILGASLILHALAYDLRATNKLFSEKRVLVLGAVGVMLYSGIGLFCMLLGGNFLDFSVLHAVLPATDEVMARSHGMLGVEIGVGLTVMAIMYSLYLDLASHGHLDEGL